MNEYWWDVNVNYHFSAEDDESAINYIKTKLKDKPLTGDLMAYDKRRIPITIWPLEEE